MRHSLQLGWTRAVVCSSWAVAICGLFWIAMPIGSNGQDQPRPLPTDNTPPSLEQSHAAFRSTHDLEIRCVASEPQIVDPISMQFDEQGNLWVVEMPDYPIPVDPNAPPQGRIKRLRDRDGDGFYEEATTFAENLDFATGIVRFKDGWMATVAGRMDLLRDTNGDGVSDWSSTRLSGFARDNTQLRANHPTWNVDGWIYISNGLRGGSVTSSTNAGSPVNLQGSDLRFSPFTLDNQAATGIGQFGLTFDGLGNRFVCSNRNPALQIVLERRDVELNPLATPPVLTHNAVIDGEASRIYPLSHFWTTSNLHAGQFTAACGVLKLRTPALASNSSSWVLTCDPTGNLVHAESLELSGVEYRGTPVGNQKEFLASLDPWFRPVDLQHGPDGALYVVDMCRAVIEHPDFMPTELKTRADLRWGQQAGRIWRVVAKDDSALTQEIDASQSLERLAKLSTGLADQDSETADTLALALRSNSPWEQDQAFRLALESLLTDKTPGDFAIELSEALRQLRDDATAASSSRIRAFRLLTFGDPLRHDEAQWTEAFESVVSSNDAFLIADALKFGRDHDLTSRLTPSTLERLSQHSDAMVRFQTALSLAQVDHESKIDWLKNIALKAQSRFEFEAVLIGSTKVASDLWLGLPIDRFAAAGDSLTQEAYLRLLGMALSEAGAEDTSRLFAHAREVAQASNELTSLRLIELVIERSGWAALVKQGEHPADWDQASIEWWKEWNEQVASWACDSEREIEVRCSALRMQLTYSSLSPNAQKTGSQWAIDVLNSTEPAALKSVALLALSDQTTADDWNEIWVAFQSQSPSVRSSIVSAAVAQPLGRASLATALNADRVRAADLSPTAMQRLANSEPDVAAALAQWKTKLEESRNAIDWDGYRAAITQEQDPYIGQQLFTKHCAACHRIGEIGVDVGPDISDSRVKEPAQYLEDILNPNGSIDANFVAYAGETVDGGSFVGVLVSETANSVTLKLNEGRLMTIERSELSSFQSTGRSLMPERLDQTLPPQELAQIIAFVKRWRYLETGVPGVEPKRESPDIDSQ